MQWGGESRCGKGHCEAPAGMQGGLTEEQVVAGRCQEGWCSADVADGAKRIS